MHIIYGPYLSKDGRFRLFIRDEYGLGITVSYPKYLVEINLEIKLKDNEIVHHKDNNPLNNELTNLEILTNSEHARLHQTKNEIEIFICRHCDKIIEATGSKLNDIRQNRKRGKSGPYCSRSCAGKGPT